MSELHDDDDPGPEPPPELMARAPRRAPDERSAPRESTMRVPPSNLEAEESLLGAMLLSRDAIATATEIVHNEDFYKPAHAHIFDAVTVLYSSGEAVDPVTVAEQLRRADLLDAVGGAAALVSLQANTPATTSAARYARIVEELALLRRLIGAAGDIAEVGYGRPTDVTKAVDHAESLIFGVAQRRVTDSMSAIRELLDENLNRLELLYERGDEITGLPSGFGDLDELLSGLQPNALYVVGARPAMGKTSFALGIAAHAAMHAQRPVLLFSLEMSRLELTQRILCSEARVDSSRMRNGRLAEADWTKISHAVGRLAEAPMWIDDNPTTTIMEIRSKARRLKGRVGDLGLVVVDYLQLMSGRTNAENRQVEISEISRGLKILARELETPVIALSQLSRNLEQRADKRPVLSDLRESGCLTADTKIVRRDNGAEVTLGELLERGERNIPVWTLDEHFKLVPGCMTHVFPSGTKRVFRMRLRSGRSVKASANHPFLRLEGWTPLEDLAIGDRIAVPRRELAPATPNAMPENEVDDSIPAEVWGLVRKAMPEHGVTTRELARQLDMSYAGSTLYKSGVSRARLARVAAAVPDPVLRDLATSDVLWDEIVSIDDLGEHEVFDATVPGTHNFIADGVIAHNSIEQDADVVMFIYRDEIYNPESADRGKAEIIVSKHRNGPTGVVELAFLDHYTQFASMAKGP